MRKLQVIKQITKTLAVLLGLLFASLSFLPYSNMAFAQTRPFDAGKIEVVDPGNSQGGVATLKGLEVVFSNVLTIALSLAAIVLFIMFLTGGFKYLTSGGDAKATEAARGTITHAIAGLVVLILAYLILVLITTITGVNVTIFRIYKP